MSDHGLKSTLRAPRTNEHLSTSDLVAIRSTRDQDAHTSNTRIVYRLMSSCVVADGCPADRPKVKRCNQPIESCRGQTQPLTNPKHLHTRIIAPAHATCRTQQTRCVPRPDVPERTRVVEDRAEQSSRIGVRYRNRRIEDRGSRSGPHAGTSRKHM